jgi:hypothetical protein
MSSLQYREQAIGLLHSWLSKVSSAPSPRRDPGGVQVREHLAPDSLLLPATPQTLPALPYASYL